MERRPALGALAVILQLLLVVLVVSTQRHQYSTTHAFVLGPVVSRRSDRCAPVIVSSNLQPLPQSGFWNRQTSTSRIHARNNNKNNNDDDEEEEEDPVADLSDKDWRAFRAKLVMREPARTSQTAAAAAAAGSTKTSSTTAAEETIIDDGDLDGIGALFAASDTVVTTTTSSPTSSSTSATTLEQLEQNMTPLDPSQWAYDSGTVIETGAVILGGVEQDFGFGLRQQYFHKAAILVLEHDDRTFTKGIIINRPSDLILHDEYGNDWRLNFGGDVQGLTSDNPDLICLHTLSNERVRRASITVVNDIQYTSLEAAQQLVQTGLAKPSDFWVFAGYAGWGPQQLLGELERKSWYMVATDSQTLLKELLWQKQTAPDPRDAGLEMWQLLMRMMGRAALAQQKTGSFEDCMLKEWALQHLLSEEAGGGAGKRLVPAPNRSASSTGSSSSISPSSTEKSDPVDRLLERVTARVRDLSEAAFTSVVVKDGMLLRATDKERSPFLLDDQALHKSLVLIIAENEAMSVGVILNRPSVKGLSVTMREKSSSNNEDDGPVRQLNVPLRYGGPYTVKGSEPLLWLHCNSVLKTARVGAPVGDDEAGLWKCTHQDMMLAVGRGLATPEDFLVATGVSVWSKGPWGKTTRGMQGEIQEGRFEVVPLSHTEDVWNALLRQSIVNERNFDEVMDIGETAWRKAGSNKPTNGKSGSLFNLPIGGLGEGFDEEDDSLVYKSDVKVSKLADDALKTWVAAFLLGDPKMGESS